MKFLPFPIGVGDEALIKQCKQRGWKAYEKKWLQATANYRSEKGDPWKVTPADFSKFQKRKLRKLYETKSRGTQITAIRSPEKMHRSCPMCGSASGPSVDHYLPKTPYAEFSILLENLVPSCTTCNSEAKGNKIKGESPLERFIHPYYDEWASNEIWLVGFGSDLEAIVYTALPAVPADSPWIDIISFHLSNILTKTWERNCRSYMAALPNLIQNRVGQLVTAEDVKQEVGRRLSDEICEKGVNGWTPAFLRGVLRDERMPQYLADRVNQLPK